MMFHANVCLARAMARLFKILVRLKQHNSVTKIISQKFVDLVTSKAGAKHDLLFNKTAFGVLYPQVNS